jgi:hypothetical protein
MRWSVTRLWGKLYVRIFRALAGPYLRAPRLVNFVILFLLSISYSARAGRHRADLFCDSDRSFSHVTTRPLGL